MDRDMQRLRVMIMEKETEVANMKASEQMLRKAIGEYASKRAQLMKSCIANGNRLKQLEQVQMRSFDSIMLNKDGRSEI